MPSNLNGGQFFKRTYHNEEVIHSSAIVFQRPDGKRVVICGNTNNEAKSISIEIVNSKSSNSKYLNATLAAHSFNTFVEK